MVSYALKRGWLGEAVWCALACDTGRAGGIEDAAALGYMVGCFVGTACSHATENPDKA